MNLINTKEKRCTYFMKISIRIYTIITVNSVT